ncbi:FKBP-type peptidyl-prolyl cis-trans isomerase [Shewanella baltica]|uniref:FKBP-type peptidyl-prolyl cis-trans isomerase n=1 Tax=Shewanella TaxID=22 RepID=UPI000E05B331|nr:FKBP-type peptidyl-prolyl cis-trans isomerase [Shewanella baltica]MCS6096821.1 FKBP-type peptidyl-prolyl cis-trans isomerase [Shewanella baltica]MCS6154642.1 FKBP-type peptidyl-prolyl cis-trans isomerase [Shewanella baltica]MCS6193287.1 FKBP-type peptidyl-prolyl cis-trans isomerase [Shewanella baltica]MCS6206654.1 FKBP-type peptidyl-prolyl cis-trans isomerase [Shewanella baltica]MCS6227806.1 FKBP-type peptidyl-prolyl cis-trans isomerase [Shewanella baltica]
MKTRMPTSFIPKTLTVATCAALFVSVTSFAAPSLKSDADKTSYSIGASIGNYISGQVYNQVELGSEVNIDLVVQGFVDALKDKQQLTDEEVVTYLNQRAEELNAARKILAEKEMAETKKASADYLAQNAKQSNVKVTASGLQYQVITQGSGQKPNPEDVVTVEYVGTLIDGTEFENTVGRKEPTRFALMTVIPGWEEGLKLMPMGSKYRFVVPASLAYGTEAVGIIPPESALIFEIELKNIEKPSEIKEMKHQSMMPAHG